MKLYYILASLLKKLQETVKFRLVNVLLIIQPYYANKLFILFESLLKMTGNTSQKVPSALPAASSEIKSEGKEKDRSMSCFLWNTLNFTTVAAATSAGIVAIQSPIRTILLNLSAHGSLPMTPYRGGILGLVRVYYAGTHASLSGSTIRTAYVCGTKKNQKDEILAKEEAVAESRPSMNFVMAAAFGDVAVTQIPSSLSDYRKLGIISGNFKWLTTHNVFQLMKGGLAGKYSSSMINFTSLCVVEKEYAQRISFEDPKVTHFISGAFSGMTAAALSYPFAAFIDFNAVKTRIEEGQLVNHSELKSVHSLMVSFVADPKKSTAAFLIQAAKQMPFRMSLTGSVFSIVAGVGEALGTEPLRRVIPEKYVPYPHRFFSPLAVCQETSKKSLTLDLADSRPGPK